MICDLNIDTKSCLYGFSIAATKPPAEKGFQVLSVSAAVRINSIFEKKPKSLNRHMKVVYI